jgi:hypothetical protein
MRAMLLAAELMIDVTFDSVRGYVATHPNLPQPVIALSLGGLRARIGAGLGRGSHNVRLKLDRAASAQRDERRRGAAERASDTRRAVSQAARE